MESRHIPVLLHETLHIVNPQPNECVIDGTLGGGGHACALLERIAPRGTFIGFERDKDAFEKTSGRLLALRNTFPSLHMHFFHTSYADILETFQKEKFPKANVLFLDVGFSSDQLFASRGFSFEEDAPLDMRYDVRDPETAAYVVNTYKEHELADIFWKLGDERRSRRIARAMVEVRKRKNIRTARELRDIVWHACGEKRGKTHPATKIFLALRRYVNREDEHLNRILSTVVEIVAPGGRVGIITFHSGEDRMVKYAFRDLEKQKKGILLTKKPIVPTKEEEYQNPRSRSAKFRAIQITS